MNTWPKKVAQKKIRADAGNPAADTKARLADVSGTLPGPHVPSIRRSQTMKRSAWLGLLLVLGCGAGSTPSELQTTGGLPAPCSQLHRAVSRWQGEEVADCGPDASGLLELTPIGNDWLLLRRRFSPSDDLLGLTAEGAPVSDGPTSVNQIMGAGTAGFAVLPGVPPQVFAYDPRQSHWNLFVTQRSPLGRAILVGGGDGVWPSDVWPPNKDGGPWDHQFIGLENGNLLDRDLGSGSTRIWSVAVAGSPGASPVSLVPSPTLIGAAQPRFTRGHRLVHLGPNRLLEWLPRPCATRTVPSDPCSGSDYNVWGYALDDGATFTPQIVSSGFWPDIGDESDILADEKHLFVWTRATGRLRSFPLDAALVDPLGQPTLADPPPDARLASLDWSPPTAAPAIKHLVLIIQDGRSFDSYFGSYCQGVSNDGAALACTASSACCEAMPISTPGAPACVDPDSDPSYQPADAPDCLRQKMNDGAMDGFAVSHPPGPCGDPRDFACAGPGGFGPYQDLAVTGTLADRFFQTYGFEDGVEAALEPAADIENLLYLITSRFTAAPTKLVDTPLLTKELARLQVSWAIYAGPKTLPLLRAFGVPIFYDPDWFPFRSLNDGELTSDIAAGTLPSVAVILPDRDDPLRSEAPGQPSGAGIAYTRSLVDAIAATPYANDTLVLLTYLTAGGFYDHVPPPAPPPLQVDGSSETSAQATAVHYGPRVPLLALGRFARPNTISHEPLEMSSLTRFVEWNWMHGATLKGNREGADVRVYRDRIVNNLGSLIDGAAAGVDVPRGPQ